MTLQNRKQALAQLTVTAPASGVITGVTAKVGDNLSVGSILGTIIDPKSLVFTLPVRETNISRVVVGDPADLALGPDSLHRTGKVLSVGTQGYLQGNNLYYDVKIGIQYEELGALRPGMSGYAVLTTSHPDLLILEGKGTIDTAIRQDMKLAQSGTLSTLNIVDGSPVSAGQTLAVLTNDSVTLAEHQAEIDRQSAEQQLQNLLQPPVTASAGDLKNQELNVQQLELTLGTKQRQVDKLTIRAPLSGTIITRNLNVGDKIAGTNTVLATVADFSKMQVVLNVDELDIGKVKMGQKAEITVDALPGRSYQGEVVQIAPSGMTNQGVTTFPVTLAVSDPKDIIASMTVNATIKVAERRDVVQVPIEAVRAKGKQQYVRLLVDGQAKPVEVKTGLSSDTMVEIQSGVNPGDLVITGDVSTSQNLNQRFQQRPPMPGRSPMGGGGSRRGK